MSRGTSAEQLQRDLAYWRRVSALRMSEAREAKKQGRSVDIYILLARSYSRHAQAALRQLRAAGIPEQGALL